MWDNWRGQGRHGPPGQRGHRGVPCRPLVCARLTLGFFGGEGSTLGGAVRRSVTSVRMLLNFVKQHLQSIEAMSQSQAFGYSTPMQNCQLAVSISNSKQ